MLSFTEIMECRKGLKLLGCGNRTYKAVIDTYLSNCQAKISKIWRCNYTSSANSTNNKPYIPRRTVMYVPGHDPKKLKKIPHLGVDCAVLECEDGVAINMKAEARKNIRDALEYLDVKTADLALRINSRSSQLMEADLGAIIGAELGAKANVRQLPQTILLPKVDSVEDLVIVSKSFKYLYENIKLDRGYCPYLLIYVESSQALLNMRDILKIGTDLTQLGVFQLDGVIFGSDDFVADIGAERTLDAKELMYARQKIVSVSKAFRLQVIDMVYLDIQDIEGLQRQSQEGAKMGFTGKQVIHPKQIQIVEAAFTPSPAKVDWALQLIQGFEEHQKSGKGAFVFRGQMIDMPLLRQAKNILKVIDVHKQAS
ncbi:unnamed protein product [Lymnaea stagnalis]|uniref:Citramalyl-CoA lyase, mitochondrial n=1 Tax=Lymnaea stagnalis TaxID=6523 RepID=A0AAV2IE20_LYMST